MVTESAADRLNTWRRALAAISSVEARIQAFENAADDIGKYIARGLEKAVAADWLHELATAHGLFEIYNEDDIQLVIADAIERGDQMERVPDIEPNYYSDSGEPVNGNGKTRSTPAMLAKADFIAGFKPPDYLIDGMLQRRFIYALTGQTGHAKTAIALLLAELVSSENRNAVLGTHKVESGRVVYFVGENADDIRMRVIGADSCRKDDGTADQVFFIPGVFNIEQFQTDLAEQLTRLGGVDLVIIDTSAAYFLGNEELSNTQMGNHARMLRRLTELPGGPCVLVLCHPIKYVTEAAQLLPRGGGAFLAEMDGNLTVIRHDDMLVELHHGKIRGPGFEPLSFKLDRITTPRLVDSKQRQIPTVRALPIGRAAEGDQQRQTREDEDRSLVALLKNPDASIADIAEANGWTFGNGEPAKSRVQRAMTRLYAQAKPALLRKNRERWELTEAGKTLARRAALDFEHRVALSDEIAKQARFDL